MIEAKNLIKSHGTRRVVDEVSFGIERGEIVGLLGPNGAGKTTSFYMIVGLVRPDGGQVFLDNQDVTNMPMYKRARAGLGYLPQEQSIFKKLTVEENIVILWEVVKNIPKSAYESRLVALLEEMGLTHLRKARGVELSGGEKRRVEIARTLAMDPSFILLDEPFAGIDPIAVAEIQTIICQLKDKGLGVIITDHNVRETLNITDRAYILHNGKILLSGNSKDVSEDPIAKKFYLGEDFKLK
ncbi:MAG: LPS export ABC transporter ATP-binding protein [bacterium]|nr:LPS export ABC transporter ATP-binding protein [bacterium]